MSSGSIRSTLLHPNLEGSPVIFVCKPHDEESNKSQEIESPLTRTVAVD